MNISMNPLRFAAARVVNPTEPPDERIVGFSHKKAIVDGNLVSVYEPSSGDGFRRSSEEFKAVVDQTQTTKVLSFNGVCIEVTPGTSQQEIQDAYQAGLRAKLDITA